MTQNSISRLAIAGIALGIWGNANRLPAGGTLVLHVDFARTNGVIRPLHGINKGPLVAGGLLDLTEAQQALAPPFTRLHDYPLLGFPTNPTEDGWCGIGLLYFDEPSI